MSNLIDKRIEVITALIRASRPLDDIASELGTFLWDADDNHGCILRKNDIIYVINRYLSGLVGEDYIEKWANMIECREDIYFDADDESNIREAVHELANPYLTTSLNKARARELILIFT